MKAIAILPEADDAHPTAFRAVTADGKAVGRTPGEALDALTSQLGAEKADAAVIVQLFRPDSYFTAEQRERLSTLMARWRTAREAGNTLPPAEQAELERLVEEELHGSAERAAQMSRELETTGELRRHPGRKSAAPRVVRVTALLARRFAWAGLLIQALNTLIILGVLIFYRTGTDPDGLYLLTVALILLLLLWCLSAAERIAETILQRFRLGQDSLKDSADEGKHREQTGGR